LPNSQASRLIEFYPDIPVGDDTQASVEVNFILYVGWSKASHKTYAYHFVLIVAQTKNELVLEMI
jgi:hypothetical protein